MATLSDGVLSILGCTHHTWYSHSQTVDTSKSGYSRLCGLLDGSGSLDGSGLHSNTLGSLRRKGYTLRAGTLATTGYSLTIMGFGKKFGEAVGRCPSTKPSGPSLLP